MKSKIISKIIAGVTVASMLTYYALPVFAYINEETVYSKLDSEGNEYKSTVTTIVEDANGTKTVQNNLSEDLPIECKISYYLDGESMSAKEIAGKSGRVTIKLEYTNKEENKIEIDGKEEVLYTPFIVASGVVLDKEKNKNIEVTNGKIITNGNSVVAVGIAMPGMEESLDLDEVQIPSSIEISLDTDSFEMGNIISYASPKMFGDLDISIDDFDEIFSEVNELESASQQIEDGANALKNGSAELLTGVLQLKDGINTAYNGAVTIKSAVDDSINNLSNNNENAIDGETLATISEQAESLSQLSDEQKASIKAQAESSAQLSDEQKQAIKTQAESSAVLTDNQKQAIKTQAQTNATISQDVLNAIGASAEAEVEKQTGFSSLTLDEQNMLKETARTSAIAAVKNALPTIAGEAAVSGAEAVAPIVAGESAVSGAQAVAPIVAGETAVTVAQTTATKTATQTATTIVNIVGNEAKAQFTNQVKSQMETLSNGLAELTNGLGSLNSGAGSLLEGTTSLDNGVQTLSSGIEQFNRDGVQKITNLVNNDLKNTIQRVEKLEELSNNYTNYASSENRDDIKFIAIIDSIKVDTSLGKNNKDEKSKK